VTTVIITEKTSQKKDLFAAIGNKYGQIFPAEGHLLSLQEPQKVDDAWGKWSFDLLKPDEFYPTCPAPDGSPSARNKLIAIENALKTATRVILATDCDREGQLIGEELLRHFGFSGSVGRAMFTAQDEKTLRQAFENLEPNENYLNLGQAALARQQADQVYNLSLTRAATVALKQPGEYGAIGIGRVKTPTMALVCIRELEIDNFTPQDYFHLAATATTDAGQLTLRHAPKARILDPEQAELIRAAADGFEGPLKATKKIKKTKPPKLLDLPELQKICGRKWGWTADKTLSVAQELYDGNGKKIQTYPRAESRYLSENQIEDVGEIVQGLKNLAQYENIDLADPQIRTGKSGHFSDAGLKGVSHHAIIPNKNTMDRIHTIYPRLTEDERKMFDLVAGSYLAILMPDYVYESTVVAMDVPGPNNKNMEFKITGNIPKEQGWRSVFTDEMEKKEEHAGELPPVKDGDIAHLHPVTTDAKKTKAPPRFNEGSLIDAMQNAWKFVEDKNVQERLKEAKGIGTPATRAAIITGLKRQNFIAQKGKHIVPTNAGLTLFKTLKTTAPELVDPGVTALWEMKLDDILLGKQTARQVWDEIGDATARLIGVLRDNAAKAPKITTGVAAPKNFGKSGGKPTEKMVATAKSIADRKGVKLPKGYTSDFQACKDFLDEHLGGNPLIAIEKRLGSGMIKGLGPAIAKLLVTEFGAEVFNVLEQTPEKLSSVKGVGPKIVTAIEARNAISKLQAFLKEHKVAPLHAHRLYAVLGDKCEETLTADPYGIIRSIPWMPFNVADCIAQKTGLTADDPVRAQAAIYRALDTARIPCKKSEVLDQLSARLGLSLDILETALLVEISNKEIFETSGSNEVMLGLTADRKVGKAIGKFLKSLASGDLPWPAMPIDKAADWAAGQLSVTFTPQQFDAIEAALSTKCMFLSSHKETGGEDVIRAICKILGAKGIGIAQTAATQAGSLHLSELTGVKGKPAPQLLKWSEKTGKFKHSAKKPIDCQLMIIDQGALMEPSLFAAVLNAIPETAAVLITGDADQLTPPFGCRALEEIVINGDIRTVYLREHLPEYKDSTRAKNNTLLRGGLDISKDPAVDPETADFFCIDADNPSQAIAKCFEIVKNRLPERYKLDAISDIQLICTKSTGPVGSKALNTSLQQVLNSAGDTPFVDRFGYRYRNGDKVIVLHNDIVSEMNGGDVGYVTEIDKQNSVISVNIAGKSKELPFDGLDIFSPAYALSASYAAASSARFVVVIDDGAATSPKLKYSALSRSSERVIFLQVL